MSSEPICKIINLEAHARAQLFDKNEKSRLLHEMEQLQAEGYTQNELCVRLDELIGRNTGVFPNHRMTGSR